MTKEEFDKLDAEASDLEIQIKVLELRLRKLD